ncbi:MAG: hypothetical protein GF341_02415 [candidate division Zixibacteria bacterium]|nr:hypothetical protein [candidate division Zixibacteria bacterium]
MTAVLWLIVVGSLLVPTTSHAESPLVIGGTVGAGHYPLSDWSDFWEEVSIHYSDERISPSWTAFIGYEILNHHTLKLTVGHHCIRTQGVLTITSAPDDPSPIATLVVDWDLSATPVGVAYEFTPRLNDHVDLLAGVEAAYYWSRVDGTVQWAYDPDELGPQLDNSGSREEEGYGLTIYLGVRTPISDRVALTPMVRARYADASDFTDHPKSAPIEFTGYDVALGVEIRPF